MKVSALLEMDLWMKEVGVLSLSQVNNGIKTIKREQYNKNDQGFGEVQIQNLVGTGKYVEEEFENTWDK